MKVEELVVTIYILDRMETLVHIGDILAIPFFLLGFFYFYNIRNRTWTETLLLVFCLVGLLADSIFTWNYFFYKHILEAMIN